MPSIRVNGFDLFYQEAGVGPPVVYVHGGFPSLDTVLLDPAALEWTWENEFAAHFRFITYDRRGCYRSSCPDEGYDLLNQAGDLESLLDALQIDSAHVIGSSAGGPIALLFAATRPGRTRSMVLVGTALTLFPLADPVSDLVREQIRFLEEQGAESAFEQRPEGVEVSLGVLWEAEEADERGTLDEYREQQRRLVERASKLPKAERVRRYALELQAMKAYMDTDLRPYAKEVRAPTLVLHGSNDREIPVEWGEELASSIPTAQLHIFQGLSHSLAIRSKEARRRITSFIQEMESRKPAR